MSAPPPPSVPGPPPPAPPPLAPATGLAAWAVGLSALVCVPFLASLVASVLMIVIGRGQRGKGELAEGNGRAAADWGLTYLIATVLLVGAHLVLLFTFAREHSVGFFPLGIPITVWVLLSVVHLVVSIVGMVRAGRQQVFRPPALRLLRA